MPASTSPKNETGSSSADPVRGAVMKRHIARLLRCAALALTATIAAFPQAGQSGAGLSLSNFRDASMFDLLEILARRLAINYVVDPAVQDGAVTVNTYGTISEEDLFPLLETILRMNGATAVRVGNLYRVVPLDELPRLPIAPLAGDSDVPEDQRPVLNVIRLQHASAADLGAILEPFLGPGGRYSVVDQANTVLLMDSGQNMRRIMELVDLFDTSELSDTRMRLLDVENGLASTLAAEIRDVFDTASPVGELHEVRFLALPRIGAVLAVSASEKSLDEAEAWIRRLDRAKATGGRQNFVYRAQYGEATNLAATISQLYAPIYEQNPAFAGQQSAAVTGTGPVQAATRGVQPFEAQIRVVPDTINNLVLVQATPQEWETIRGTLLELDGPPRQVLINARIYEVTLSDGLSSGVAAYLRNRSGARSTGKLTGEFGAGGLVNLSIGTIVGNTRELAVFLEGSATEGRTRVISAPTLIATDNVPADIVVGQTIPTLSSQAVAGGAFAEGSSLFTNTINNVQTGVSLSVTARVNESGIVTLQIAQEVSTPTGITGPIQSPTIDRRNVSTQVTVNDGDTVAIGGIIQQTNRFDSTRVPLLGKIPVLGRAFGSTVESTVKTELIVLLEPHVIYDQNQVASATEELRSRMRLLRRLARDLPDEDQNRSAKSP